MNLKLNEKILSILRSNRSVLLVGQTNSGKTWFIKKEFMPFLKKQNIKTVYFANPGKLFATKVKDADFIIVDEVEIMQDKDFLQNIHFKENPYYSPKYLNKVKKWFNNLKYVGQPSIFIVTREKEAIKNLIKTVKILEWNNQKVRVVEFKRI